MTKKLLRFDKKKEVATQKSGYATICRVLTQSAALYKD